MLGRHHTRNPAATLFNAQRRRINQLEGQTLRREWMRRPIYSQGSARTKSRFYRAANTKAEKCRENITVLLQICYHSMIWQLPFQRRLASEIPHDLWFQPLTVARAKTCISTYKPSPSMTSSMSRVCPSLHKFAFANCSSPAHRALERAP